MISKNQIKTIQAISKLRKFKNLKRILKIDLSESQVKDVLNDLQGRHRQIRELVKLQPTT